MAGRSHRRSWQFILILAALTVLASSRAVNERRRQSGEQAEHRQYTGRVSNGQTEEVGGADFQPSEDQISGDSINPLLDLSGLGESSGFEGEQGELSGAYPKSLNDFYKGARLLAAPPPTTHPLGLARLLGGGESQRHPARLQAPLRAHRLPNHHPRPRPRDQAPPHAGRRPTPSRTRSPRPPGARRRRPSRRPDPPLGRRRARRACCRWRAARSRWPRSICSRSGPAR